MLTYSCAHSGWSLVIDLLWWRFVEHARARNVSDRASFDRRSAAGRSAVSVSRVGHRSTILGISSINKCFMTRFSFRVCWNKLFFFVVESRKRKVRGRRTNGTLIMHRSWTPQQQQVRENTHGYKSNRFVFLSGGIAVFVCSIFHTPAGYHNPACYCNICRRSRIWFRIPIHSFEIDWLKIYTVHVQNDKTVCGTLLNNENLALPSYKCLTRKCWLFCWCSPLTSPSTRTLCLRK